MKFESSNNSIQEQNQSYNINNDNLNMKINKKKEETEIDWIIDNKANESNEEIEEIENKDEDEEEEEDDEKKEKKIFTIELLIYTKVMDNREEIKKYIFKNYINLEEKENDKNYIKDLKENENVFIEKEIISSIEIPIIKELNDIPILKNLNLSDNFYIKLNDLTKSLKNLGFPLDGSMINIYDYFSENYVFFGAEPFDNKTILYSYMLEPNKDFIKMKIINYIQKKMLDGYTNRIINTYFRKTIKKVLPSLEIKTKIFMPSTTNLEYYPEGSDNDESSSSLSCQSFQSCKYKDKDSNLSKDKNNEKKKKKLNFGKMTESHKRERKIGYIIEKVYSWRKMYNGYKDQKNNFIKYSLDKAAEKINISKKSLDDYLLQIRLGRKYGFDFDKNKYKKIGVLRDYVKNIIEREPNLEKKKIQKKRVKKDIKEIKENKKEKKKGELNEKKNNNIKCNNSLFKDLDLEIDNSKSKEKINDKSFIGKKRQSKL